jgi:hypothetical protein
MSMSYGDKARAHPRSLITIVDREFARAVQPLLVGADSVHPVANRLAPAR